MSWEDDEPLGDGNPNDYLGKPNPGKLKKQVHELEGAIVEVRQEIAEKAKAYDEVVKRAEHQLLLCKQYRHIAPAEWDADARLINRVLGWAEKEGVAGTLPRIVVRPGVGEVK